MGFAFPAGLLALGFLGVLVWIWLRERAQRPLEVPSLLLWRSVHEEAPRTRFRPDPVFLLQCLLLAALALGLARPWVTDTSGAGESRRVVLLFDTSASMQTMEDGERRFDRARREARSALAGLGAADEVMIVAVEARPRLVLAFTTDRGRVARAVDGLEPGDGPTRLALGLQLARSAGGGRTIELYVFTDLPRAELAAPLAANERLHYFRFGVSDDNVAIAALRVYQNPFQEAGEARAYALLKNYSAREREAALVVSLGGREILRETFRLGAREGRAVPIRDLGGAGKLEARLEAADALSVDNRAIAWVREPRRVRVLAVSADESLFTDLRALAEAVPAIVLAEARPDAVAADALAGADVALFHGTVPEKPVAVNALYVYPPPGNPLFPVEGDVVEAQILDWNERDPILRDLRYVEALPLERSRVLRRPEWARTLITSRAGDRELALAFAGETAGRRIVCFAFDLAEHSVRRSENLSLLLLVLNAIRWLTPPEPGEPVQVDVGDRYRESLPEPGAVRIGHPDGHEETLPARTEVVVDVDRRGLYEIGAGDRHRLVLANLFDSEESDVGRAGEPFETFVEGGSASVRTVTARSLREVGGGLYLAALVLVFGEWGLALWRRRRDG